MKKIIERKSYNTETAELIGSYENTNNSTDFNWCSEDLYRTKKGQLFIHGSGGANSKYAKTWGNSSWGSDNIILLSVNEAINWLEKHDLVEEIEKYFSNEIEIG